jgi:hypothetical protein
VLGALRESDPFGLRARMASGAEQVDGSLSGRVLAALAAARVPGTPAWAAMSVEQRCRWWVRRVGRFTTLLASVPGIGGALADRLPVRSALGAAGQGLLLVAVAGEHGVHDESELVALLGAVLFRRDVRAAQVARTAGTGGPDSHEIDEQAAELTGELAEPGRAPTLKRIGGAVWRLGRALVALGGELDKRPRGRWYHQMVGMLPLVGMLGEYLGEWSGLKRAARKGGRWLRRYPAPEAIAADPGR